MKRLASLAGTISVAAAFILVPLGALAVDTAVPTLTSVSTTSVPTVNGTTYTAGQALKLNDTYNGDIFCAGQDVTINGPVTGDINCAGQTVTINGNVDGSVRIAGQTVTMNGTVSRSATVFAQTFTLGADAKVGTDMTIAAQSVTLEGTVARNVYGAMTTLALTNTIGGDVNVVAEHILFGTSSSITGNLTYANSTPLVINSSKVGGTVTYNKIAENTRKSNKAFSATAWLGGFLYTLLATLAIALPLAWLVARPVRRLSFTMLKRPGASIGWGFLALLVSPFVFILGLLTFIGIPLILLLTVGWITLMCLSSIFAGIAIGQFITKKADWHAKSLVIAALVGVPLMVIVTAIPILGFFVGLVAIWWTLGGTILSLPALRD